MRVTLHYSELSDGAPGSSPSSHEVHAIPASSLAISCQHCMELERKYTRQTFGDSKPFSPKLIQSERLNAVLHLSEVCCKANGRSVDKQKIVPRRWRGANDLAADKNKQGHL